MNVSLITIVVYFGKLRFAKTLKIKVREVNQMRIVAKGLQIRPMAEEDFHDVFRLYRQVVSRNTSDSEFDFFQIFKSFLGNTAREAYVATVHQRVIGLVTLYYLDVMRHCGQIASIQELVVTEEFQGRGVGEALLEFVKAKVKEKNCRGLEVAADPWQKKAKTFYEQCGWHGKILNFNCSNLI